MYFAFIYELSGSSGLAVVWMARRVVLSIHLTLSEPGMSMHNELAMALCHVAVVEAISGCSPCLSHGFVLFRVHAEYLILGSFPLLWTVSG